MGVSDAVREPSLEVWNFSKVNRVGSPTHLPGTHSQLLTHPVTDPLRRGFQLPARFPDCSKSAVIPHDCYHHTIFQSGKQVQEATWLTHGTTSGAAPRGGGEAELFWVLQGRVSGMNGSHVASLMSQDIFSEAAVPWALTPKALPSSEALPHPSLLAESGSASLLSGAPFRS